MRSRAKPVISRDMWHSWFAWKPVRVRIPIPGHDEGRLYIQNPIGTHCLVWLERIERKVVMYKKHPIRKDKPIYTYRFPTPK